MVPSMYSLLHSAQVSCAIKHDNGTAFLTSSAIGHHPLPVKSATDPEHGHACFCMLYNEGFKSMSVQDASSSCPLQQTCASCHCLLLPLPDMDMARLSRPAPHLDPIVSSSRRLKSPLLMSHLQCSMQSVLYIYGNSPRIVSWRSLICWWGIKEAMLRRLTLPMSVLRPSGHLLWGSPRFAPCLAFVKVDQLQQAVWPLLEFSVEDPGIKAIRPLDVQIQASLDLPRACMHPQPLRHAEATSSTRTGLAQLTHR